MKKCVPALRSSSSIVRPGARATAARRRAGSRTSSIDQTNSGMRIHVIPRVRMFAIVTMKLIAPSSDDDREDVQREDPVVLAVARAVLCSPTAAGTTTSPPSPAAGREEAQVQDDPAEQEQPVRERVQPRERHVARADHQRHEVVAEAGEDRDDDEEDHRRAVDRQHLVVRVLRQERLVRRRELRAHEQREDAAGDEEDERRRDVEDPDPLVVDGDEPARDAAALPAHGRNRIRPNRHSPLPCRRAC